MIKERCVMPGVNSKGVRGQSSLVASTIHLWGAAPQLKVFCFGLLVKGPVFYIHYTELPEL